MADVDTGMGYGKAAREGVAIITTVARQSGLPQRLNTRRKLWG